VNSYSVEFTRAAEKSLARILKAQPTIGKKIANIIDRLQNNPQVGIPLRGKLYGCYKYRFSHYRIVYQIHERVLQVIILDIGDRKNIYLHVGVHSEGKS
jgi:mRNA interferase RelE/StbE